MSSDDVHFIHIVKILYTVTNLGTRGQVPFATARNTKYSVTKGTKYILILALSVTFVVYKIQQPITS